MLKITDLVKRYGSGDPVLKNLDLTIEGESVVSIIGSSGAGKSTLLRCINRLVEPTSGTIELNGTDLTRLRGKNLRAARRKIGMVFQGFNLVDRLTVMENVQSGRLGYISTWSAITRRYPKQDIRRAYELMERVGIAHYADTRADQLSGGERQRVWLAMLLAQDAPVLLLDEPTSALDVGHERDILQLVANLKDQNNLTVIAVLHDIDMVGRFADHIIALRAGKTCWRGTSGDFMRGETLRDIFQTDIDVIRLPGSDRAVSYVA